MEISINCYQLPATRRTIHVGDRTYNEGSTVEKHLVQDVMKSVKPWIEALISDDRYRSDFLSITSSSSILLCYFIPSDHRVMIYNGQMDIIIGWPLTESFVTSMKWKGAKKYLGWRTCPAS